MVEQSIATQSNVLDVLRARTKTAHNRLHEHSTFVALFKQALTLEDYRQLILKYHGFYAPLDNAIHAENQKQRDDSLQYPYASRGHLLKQDLRDLGFTEDEISQNTMCDDVLDLISKTSLGGVLYVIEGATLGGAGIDRAAQRILFKDTTEGRKYWAWCRSENKRCWSMINAYLKKLDDAGASVDALAQGAQDTFTLFERWLAPLDKNTSAFVTQ